VWSATCWQSLTHVGGFACSTYTQPSVASHVSAVQGSPSSQLTGAPMQAPPEQVSPTVQALPSLHRNPSSSGPQLAGHALS
jgi:hypothetical protein